VAWESQVEKRSGADTVQKVLSVQNLVIRPRWIALSAVIVAVVLLCSASTGLAFQKTTTSSFGRTGFGNSGQQACDPTNAASAQAGASFLTDQLSAVASALHLDAATLQSDLASGTSLSQIISAQGMTSAQVEQAIVAQEKTQLDQQVSSGRMTVDEENATLATTSASVERVLSGQAPLTGTASRQNGSTPGGTANGQFGQSRQGRQGFNACGG
jgi:hypothetical protein